MKKILLLTLIISLFAFCKKKKNETEPLNESFNAKNSTLISQAAFSSNGSYNTSGNVKLFSQNGSKTLVFENFMTSNGPDLRVYLSTSISGSNFIDLGVLKSTSGNFNYNVNENINTTSHKYILIWCEDFSVIFGNAVLQ